LEIKIPHLSRYGTLSLFLHVIPLQADAFSTLLANSAKEAPAHNSNHVGHVTVLKFPPPHRTPIGFLSYFRLRQAVFSIKVKVVL